MRELSQISGEIEISPEAYPGWDADSEEAESTLCGGFPGVSHQQLVWSLRGSGMEEPERRDW